MATNIRGSAMSNLPAGILLCGRDLIRDDWCFDYEFWLIVWYLVWV